LTPTQALAGGAPLIHSQANGYKKVMTDIYPEAGTNVASRYRMRKGNTAEAFGRCEVVVERRFFLPPSDHLAMEVRTARAEISADGEVVITTSSQAPYAVRKQLPKPFPFPRGKSGCRFPSWGRLRGEGPRHP
jgi:CO/xanthine dehydrogenase Mo-binding subunit